MLQKWNIYITYWNRTLREIENGTYVRHLAKAKRKAEQEGRELPAEMPFKKIRPPSGAFGLDEDTKEGPLGFLDSPTGSNPVLRDEVVDELEEVWERVAPSQAKPNPAMPPSPRSPKAPPPLPPPAQSASQARASSVATPLPKPPPIPRSKVSTPLPKIPGMNEQDLRSLHQRYVDAQKASGAAASVKYETLVNSLAKQVPSVLGMAGVKGVRFEVTVENGKPVLKAIPQK
jgi:hypothetical protein